MKKAAYIILEHRTRGILFLLRDNKSTIPYPDYWDLIGGGIEKGETPEKALKREVKEEIGYDLKEFSFFKKNTVFWDEVRQGESFIFTGTIATKDADAIRLGDEGQRMRFFKRDEVLQQKLPENVKEVLREYLKR